MINAIIVGACGKMGGFVANEAKKDGSIKIVGGVDRINNGADFPIFSSFDDINVKADVIIDFSNPLLLDDILKYAKSKKIPTVIATTGFSDLQIEKIKEASAFVPIFFTFNMSLGINLLCSLVKTAAGVLGSGFDVEIIEKHHNQKIDAPSGTALMLADAVNNTLGDEMVYEYDRHSKRIKRKTNEIGIHSVRGGTIVGEHEVIFAGHDEVISIKHEAFSREVFAVGAIKAAKLIATAENGIYDMTDIIKIH